MSRILLDTNLLIYSIDKDSMYFEKGISPGVYPDCGSRNDNYFCVISKELAIEISHGYYES